MTNLEEPVAVTRAFVVHQPKWQRFQTTTTMTTSSNNKSPYQRQYAHVYHQRLAMLAPKCWNRVDQILSQEKEKDSSVKVLRILELQEGIRSFVVGTLVKESEGDTMLDGCRCKELDALYLEDESGRVALQVSPSVHGYTTGVVCAVQGIVGTDGVLKVEQVVTPNDVSPLTKASPPSSDNDNNSSKGPCLLLVSGLHCGDPTVSSLPRDLLLTFLEGHLAKDKAAQIAHMVIAGGLVAKINDTATTSNEPQKRGESSASVQSTVASLRELDRWIVQATAAGIPMDVFGGKDDPTTANWPQRPLHRSLLPNAHRYVKELLHCSPNPYAATLHEQSVVGTDGTNITDLVQSVLMEDSSKVSELEALRRTLEWSHVCPTGPDSVPTVPHMESDPMVLDQVPNVYFCGNATKFDTASVSIQDRQDTKECRLICVPDFGTTGEAVLVHLETNEVEVLRFVCE